MIYASRRVNCRTCGVKVELLPWADGKHHLTQAHAMFLARWGRRLSWKEVAAVFSTSWDTVYRSVAWVVEYGLKHGDLDNLAAIGVDEIQFQKWHRYLTLVYQINQSCQRLLWVSSLLKKYQPPLWHRHLARDNTGWKPAGGLWPFFVDNASGLMAD